MKTSSREIKVAAEARLVIPIDHDRGRKVMLNRQVRAPVRTPVGVQVQVQTNVGLEV